MYVLSTYEKFQISFFYLILFSFLIVKISIYLNRRIFVMAAITVGYILKRNARRET